MSDVLSEEEVRRILSAACISGEDRAAVAWSVTRSHEALRAERDALAAALAEAREVVREMVSPFQDTSDAGIRETCARTFNRAHAVLKSAPDRGQRLMAVVEAAQACVAQWEKRAPTTRNYEVAQVAVAVHALDKEET